MSRETQRIQPIKFRIVGFRYTYLPERLIENQTSLYTRRFLVSYRSTQPTCTEQARLEISSAVGIRRSLLQKIGVIAFAGKKICFLDECILQYTLSKP